MAVLYSLRLVLIPFFSLFRLVTLTVAVEFPAPYSPFDEVAINCGFAGNSTAPDGRQWMGDIGSSKFGHLGKSATAKAFQQPSDNMPNPVPYFTARISRSQFTYTFNVSPGQKFIRFHFYPASYPGFHRSKAFFTVKAGPYTLLSNFSTSLTADSLGLKSFVKEFCLNIGENHQALSITFFPSPSSSSDAAYAFVNGIEIVSMPTGLYYTKSHDSGAHVVGQNYRFYIENSTALEVVHRLNVGGNSISSFQDSGMFREWSGDSNYLSESDVFTIITTIPIKYTSIPSYTAPQKVYQTTWSMTNNLTWRLPVDLGFRYLVRLHFCELEYEIRESSHREFSIFVNEHVAEACADVIEWSGGNGIAVYRDYLVMMEGDRMEGKHDLLIALQNHCHDYKAKHGMGPILNGLEVFKLSNPDNNLAGPNPSPLADTRTSKPPELPKPVFAFDFGNGIVNGVIIFITLVNIIFYQLRTWAENSGEKKISKLSPKKEIFGCFSLAEMQLATDNFADAFVIGSGGFGKVYKGFINGGATTVAIKRLNSKSKQGAEEFWTEIEMLSKLRHSNLVTLIGYCDDYQEMMLVYEYMTQGTLADHIYKTRTSSKVNSSLTWEQRLNICIGAARGLNYLHTGTHHCVIHRDVKTTNILLDENLVAKISDFGLSKMGISSESRSYVSTNVKGTFGYLDPEYFSTRRLTRKSDVYAFGVVLLEVLCGRAAVDMRLEEEQHSLVLWARHCIRQGMLDQIIDPNLRTQIMPGCLKMFVEVAKKCLQNKSKDRPTMDEVVERLEQALAAQERSSNCSEVESINESGVDNEQDGTTESGDVYLQNIESLMFEQDHTPPSSLKRTKLTISKVVHRTTKGKDSQKKKMKDLGSKGGSSPSWWQVLKPSAKKPKAKSLAKILAATNNFDDDLIIHDLGHTTIYQGYIEDKNLVVAIQRFKPNSPQGLEVLEKMKILVDLRHAHLNSLIGYYINDKEGEVILLYGYIGNDSLTDNLFGLMDKDPMPWEKRLRICVGAAKGLQYLHGGASQPVIHGNISSTNILLDHDWEPKLGGLELFKVVARETTSDDEGNMAHTVPGYVTVSKGWILEEWEGWKMEKRDVYLFGFVLLEILSGRKCTEVIEALKSCITARCIDQIIDPYLMGNIAPECLREFVKITCCCVLYEDFRRPSMNRVVWALDMAMKLQQTSPLNHMLQSSGAPDQDDDPTQISLSARFGRAYNDALFDDVDFGSHVFFDVTSTSLDTIWPVKICTQFADWRR